jgi:type IV fimbrial biogenesis protein FimT
VLKQGAGMEGMAGLKVTPMPTGATTIAFNVFGFVSSPNPDGTQPITALDFDVPNGEDLGTARRALRVMVNTGGEIKLCDPKVASTDPRACL